MLGAVPEEKETRAATRYETVVATLLHYSRCVLPVTCPHFGRELAVHSALADLDARLPYLWPQP